MFEFHFVHIITRFYQLFSFYCVCVFFCYMNRNNEIVIFSRVNFLKYQKPEKDLSFLKNSETYRAIHHLSPVENGIEKRPAMVAAEEDLLKVKRLIHMRVPVYHNI